MIGVFDSGFGGLTVLREFLHLLPKYDYIYLGDNARTPYGNKSQEVVYKYTEEAVGLLFRKGCELIIIACNTSSAKALRKIQTEWLPKNYPEKRILGVLIPAAEAASEFYKENPKIAKRLGVIGTRSTIESKIYEAEIKKLDSGVEVFSQACPLLVPLVEEGWSEKVETKMILKKYLRPLKEKKITSLILGCTHYPFLEKDIKRILGKNVEIISTPKVVAEKLKDYLERHKDIETKIKKSGERIFYTTDSEERFREFIKKFLKNIYNIKKVKI